MNEPLASPLSTTDFRGVSSHTVTRSRTDIARSAAAHLEAARPFQSLVGFDGFIDEIIAAVDTRHAMTPEGFSRFRTITEFASRIAAAAGKSTNIELVVEEERWGGNGPLMAGALGALGSAVTYIGAVGKPDAPTQLHPLYTEFASRCAQVIPIAPPAHTDALEFEDGKVMMGKTANVQRVTWDAITAAVGLDSLRGMIRNTRLIGIVNWTMLGGVDGIWNGLAHDILSLDPGLAQSLRIFIDLSDPAKRTDADLQQALANLTKLNTFVPVTLGLNLAEAERVAATIDITSMADPSRSLDQRVQAGARDIRAALTLDCVVVHPREGAGAATAGEVAWFWGPFTPNPRLSTGAGDHFNGGFAFAQTLGLSLEESLATGCGTSGVYVRDAASPTRARLVEFLRDLPEPLSTRG